MAQNFFRKAYIFLSGPLAVTKIVKISWNFSQRCVFEISRGDFFGFLNFWKLAKIFQKNIKIWLRKAYIFLCSRLPTTKIVEIRWNFSQRRVFKISRGDLFGFLNFWKLPSRKIRPFHTRPWCFRPKQTRPKKTRPKFSPPNVLDQNKFALNVFDQNKLALNVSDLKKLARGTFDLNDLAHRKSRPEFSRP